MDLEVSATLCGPFIVVTGTILEVWSFLAITINLNIKAMNEIFYGYAHIFTQIFMIH